MITNPLDYNEYVKIAQGTYWVGYADMNLGLHCNPYLIRDGNEAVLIDSGSRNEFSSVMLKIMRSGTTPEKIKRLIYQHYDPDLCGNIPHVEAAIDTPDLQIISHYENNIFINYYGARSPKQCIESLDFHFTFSSGRQLDFIRTPYAHSPGSFMTYDRQTKVLFSSDIFGSYDNRWDLFAQFPEECESCVPSADCPMNGAHCPIHGIIDFHERIMTSSKALQYALTKIEALDVEMIAPQHGSILSTPYAKNLVIQKLKTVQSIGIDHYLKGVTQ